MVSDYLTCTKSQNSSQFPDSHPSRRNVVTCFHFAQSLFTVTNTGMIQSPRVSFGMLCRLFLKILCADCADSVVFAVTRPAHVQIGEALNCHTSAFPCLISLQCPGARPTFDCQDLRVNFWILIDYLSTHFCLFGDDARNHFQIMVLS